MNKYNFTETDKTILKRLVDEKEEEYLSKKEPKIYLKRIFYQKLT